MFKLKKPDLNKIDKEDMSKLFSDKNKKLTINFIKKVSSQQYLFWDKVKFQEPSPNVSKEAIWSLVKFFRQQKTIQTPIKDEDGNFFTWLKLDYFEEFEHKFDLNTGGELLIDQSKEKEMGQILLSRGVIEEGIASAQLEGANTTRAVAKKMLREGRNPVNHSEQMILNNYKTLRAVENEYKEREMSMDLLIELHSMITKDTLDEQGEIPRIRNKNDHIRVTDKMTGEIYHEGPDQSFVLEELEVLIKFANDEIKLDSFVHPIIKAIMLHFWIGYLHPFTDGNGRLARLIFYWYLIKNGYWAFMYLPISKMIKKSPEQYTMAYIYSEQDDYDLTYFIDYNLKKIKLAFDDFQEYVQTQTKENIKMKDIAEIKFNLNVRQIQLLQYLFSDKDARTNIAAHTNINGISKKTAINDLKQLVNDGFLEQKKQGRNMYYYSTEKINELFE